MIVNGRDIKRNDAVAADFAHDAAQLIGDVLGQVQEHRTFIEVNGQRFTSAELLVAQRVLTRLVSACDV